MLNIDTLNKELARVLGDHVEIECEIDNVQGYLDGVSARLKVAPDIGECGWLILLGLYRSARSNGKPVTVAEAAALSSHPVTVAIPHVMSLLRSEYIRYANVPGDVAPRPLALSQKGSKAIAAWLSLMHLGARTPVEITTDSVVAALHTLVSQNGGSRTQ